MTLDCRKYRLARKYAIILAGILSLFLGLSLYLLFPHPTARIVLLIASGTAAPFVLYLILMRKYRRRRKLLAQPFPAPWETLLQTQVAYYSTLSEGERERFKEAVQIFLGEKRVTGIETDVDDVIRILVAASAIIPVFNFPEWEYDELSEVLVYPRAFDQDFDFDGPEGNILGLVGVGQAMILSKPALLHGFKDAKDKMNVGLHEFIHKIDEKDGLIDGLPQGMADQPTINRWAAVMKREMERLDRGESDINPYALTNEAEFLAVASEYFFENPELMSRRHPELYEILSVIFKQDTKSLFKSTLKSLFRPYGRKIPRNSRCPCGSGRKYKKCCLDKAR